MDKTAHLRVAVIQHAPVFMNLAASLDKALALISEAAAEGAGLIVFPETWLPGYPVWLDFAPGAGLWDHPPAKALFRVLFANSADLHGPEIRQLQAAAAQHNSSLAMGMHERHKGTLYNTLLLFSEEGAAPVIHRKLMPTYTERLIWGRGDGSTLNIMPSRYGNIGGLICWEHWMPLARAAMHAREEFVHIAQWPMVKKMNLLASRHYAFEGQCFVVAAGAVLSVQQMYDGLASLGKDAADAAELLDGIGLAGNELLLRGGSTIIAPDGQCLVEPVYDSAGIFYADLDRARIVEGRLFMDSDGHYSRPDVFHLQVDTREQNGVDFSADRQDSAGDD